MKNHVKKLSFAVKGKRVLVRVDFNVPFAKDGSISDDNRIVQALPTIKELLRKEAKVVLFSHLGKINYKKTPEEIEAAKAKNDMGRVYPRLCELLPGVTVKFCKALRGPELVEAVNSLQNGEVLLLQNTRYEKGESKNDPELSKEWASIADAFVMDAFGSAHRAHCSTYGVPEILKAEGKPTAIGYLVEKEIEGLGSCVNPDAHPYIAVLGGLKVSDKIKVIDSLLKKTDKILIGGAMAYTFLRALGHKTGTSPVEEDQLDYAKRTYEEANGKIVLPIDCVATDSFDNPTDIITVDGLDLPDAYEGMDIGPKTCAKFAEIISTGKIVFWNGPMGVFEKDQFQTGTKAVMQACADNVAAKTVIGGGDSAAAAKQFGYVDKFTHVSTGGGASLELIENDGHLPGIDVIEDLAE